MMQKHMFYEVKDTLFQPQNKINAFIFLPRLSILSEDTKKCGMTKGNG